MALGQIVDVTSIPFLRKDELHNRFIPTLLFYADKNWRAWFQIESPDGQKCVEVQAFPAEAFYFGDGPERPTDLASAFLTIIGQFANFTDLGKFYSAMHDDILNLSASIAKFEMIEKSRKTQEGSARLAATEVEYILSVCRSMFDLFQELFAKIWDKTRLVADAKKGELKKAFSQMALIGGSVRSAEELTAAYGLPPAIAACYARNAPVFVRIRDFRDGLIHRGGHIQSIFAGESGFTIQKKFGPFANLRIWDDAEEEPNALVPLKPAISMIVHATLAAFEEFAYAIRANIRLMPPMVPDMNLYVRGYFNDALLATLRDADRRISDGKRLIE